MPFPIGEYTLVATRYGLIDGSTTGDFNIQVDVKAPEAEIATVYPVDADTLNSIGYRTP